MVPVALLTDFGTRDWYIASMKGVILGKAPGTPIVDITHDIPMGNITVGAFVLFAAHSAFPAGTVFAVVVDPGVGSKRLPLIARAGGYIFIGPDNGVLSPCLQRYSDVSVHELREAEYRRDEVSCTFHGRDIFAPAAAHAARGVPLSSFGPAVTEYRITDIPQPLRQGSTVAGRVLYIDRFGNAVTTIPISAVESIPHESCTVSVARRRLPLLSYYGEVGRGKPLALIGSSGFVEISVNRGSAARRLGLRVGSRVVVRAAGAHHSRTGPADVAAQ
jgi:S-adenosyl-L-methionine hydrolase (adenosine-forming)